MKGYYKNVLSVQGESCVGMWCCVKSYHGLTPVAVSSPDPGTSREGGEVLIPGGGSPVWCPANFATPPTIGRTNCIFVDIHAVFINHFDFILISFYQCAAQGLACPLDLNLDQQISCGHTYIYFFYKWLKTFCRSYFVSNYFLPLYLQFYVTKNIIFELC